MDSLLQFPGGDRQPGVFGALEQKRFPDHLIDNLPAQVQGLQKFGRNSPAQLFPVLE